MRGDDDDTDDDDAVDGVGSRHQRRMQGGGHLADDLDADEQREYEQCDGNDDVHGLFLAFCGGTSGYDEGVVKFLVQVDAQTTVMHEVGEHVAHVAGEQVRGGVGNLAGEIRGTDDGHSPIGHLRADAGSLDVAAQGRWPHSRR